MTEQNQASGKGSKRASESSQSLGSARVKVAVLASGQGRVLAPLIEASKKSDSALEIVGLIASRPGIGAIALASDHGIPSVTVEKKDFSSNEMWDRALCDQLLAWGAERVLMSGFLLRLGPIVLQQFRNTVLNSHPSLLPAHGGKGMYGRRVHEAVIAAGDPVTGITIHYVNEHYDEGQILAQREVKVLPTDTAETLEKRVLEVEKQFVTETILSLWGSGRS